jgi:hypothetical protein
LQEKEQQQEAVDEAEDDSEEGGSDDGEFEEGESSDGEPANTDIFEAELKAREEELGKHCMVVGTLDGGCIAVDLHCSIFSRGGNSRNSSSNSNSSR